MTFIYPPASEASMEIANLAANLTEWKNPLTPVYGVKEVFRLSVTKFDPNYLRTGKKEWAKKFDLSTMKVFFLGFWKRSHIQITWILAEEWPRTKQNQKPIEKKLARFAARAAYESRFFL